MAVCALERRASHDRRAANGCLWNLRPRIMAVPDQGYVRAAMGYWYHHVQSIMLAIGQYAETALGDPECF